jgi:hypothetical protein
MQKYKETRQIKVNKSKDKANYKKVVLIPEE